jgi:serine phosphatase RsbU (regulator of sigma subunit)
MMRDLADSTILLVDDNRTNIGLLVEALRGEYKLGFALDGPSALRYVHAQPTDLILLDILMPDMDGYEVCRRLREDPATRDIPVIFCTGLDEIHDKTRGFEVGAVDYITKPFEALEVKARVRTHLSLRLARQALARQRDQLSRSLDLAKEVQQNLLPRRDPVVDGYDISGRSIYSDQTGGDYYDYLLPDPPALGPVRVVVGDVSEHGIPSALFMTTARAFLRQRAAMAGDTGQVLTDIHALLGRDMEDSGRFMTMFLAGLDRDRGHVRWSNAGHDPALMYDPDLDRFDPLAGGGPALGILPRFTHAEHSHPFGPGRVLVLGTDGIWETRNAQGAFFGKDRLKAVIRERWRQPAARIVDAVLEAVQAFRHPLESADDVTLVVVKAVDAL